MGKKKRLVGEQEEDGKLAGLACGSDSAESGKSVFWNQDLAQELRVRPRLGSVGAPLLEKTVKGPGELPGGCYRTGNSTLKAYTRWASDGTPGDKGLNRLVMNGEWSFVLVSIS